MRTITAGDWVCFMSCNRLVYANIEYIVTCPDGKRELYTTEGVVQEGRVLEVRSPTQKVPCP